MHGNRVQNSLAEAWNRSHIRFPSSDDISCRDYDDYLLSRAHSFPYTQDRGAELNRITVELPKEVKSEIVDGKEPSAMTLSNVTSGSGEASGSSGTRADACGNSVQQHPVSAVATAVRPNNPAQAQSVKRKRNLPGTPDPDAEVIALSPKTLMATNRFVCEICNKGFQRDQNLQLHRRGHNLPWKLRQRTSKEIRKRVYICPEPSCVHHDPSRALGDLTGIKKHFCRKHGEKKWKCEKCSKRYAVQSDWKAHSKTCGTREYRCDCGTLFSRRDSFITHRAFCDALAEESARLSAGLPGTASRNMGYAENGLSLVPPNQWDQPSALGSGMPSSRHRLSLWLGPGPGPGPGPPPSNAQLLGPSQDFQTGELNSPLGVNPSLFEHSPRNVHGRPGMAGMLDSDYEGQKPLSNFMPLDNSSNSHFGNLLLTRGPLSAGLPNCLGQSPGIPSVETSGIADFSEVTRWADRSSIGAGRLSLSSQPGPGSSSVSGNVNAAGNVASLSALYSQTHTASAQMSATALLQKAAQMGSTSSNTWRGFGMAGSDGTSGRLGSAWPDTVADQGRGTPSMVSSVGQSHPFIRSAADVSSASQALGRSPNQFIGISRTNTETTSLHEVMDSLAGSPDLFGGMATLPSSLGQCGNIGGTLQHPGNSPFQNRMLSRDSLGKVSQQSPRGGAQHPFFDLPTCAGLGTLSRGEDGPSDRLTRDFLGVEGPSGMLEATGGTGRTFSHRDLANITSLASGLDRSSSFKHQRDDLRSIGVSSQSSGKSWDT